MRERLVCLCGAFFFTVLLCWLYYPVMGSYFANDDWVVLWYARLIPPSQPWRYFSMHTIWFYRPLQMMQYGLTWHLAGLDHRAYSVQLLAMHLGVCGLVWCLLRSLFGAAIAGMSTLFFSVSCLAPDILMWSPNFNTLQHGLTTMGASCCFLSYLKSPRRRWLASAIMLAVVNCFTKESCINLPLVLGSIWVTLYLQDRWSGGAGIKGTGDPSVSLRGFLTRELLWITRDILPYAGIALLFAAVHSVFFVNVEPWYKLIYEFTSPVVALGHLMHTINVSLFGLLSQPFIWGSSRQTGDIIGAIYKYGYIVPPLIIGLGIWRRSPAVVFAVLFAGSLQVPTFALKIYDSGRYYYVSSVGCVLLLSLVLLPPMQMLLKQIRGRGDDSVSNITGGLKSRVAGYGAIIAALTIVAGNVVAFQGLIAEKVRQSGFIKQTYQFMEAEVPKLPPNSLIVLRLDPNAFFNKGMGATEMLSMASKRGDVTGTTTDAQVPPLTRGALASIPNKYGYDVFTLYPRFERIQELTFMD